MTGLMQSVIIWLLIIVSVSLVAGITYIYSNRNLRLTILLTLCSVLGIVLIKILGTLSFIFSKQFIGRLDDLGVPYIFSKPGWIQIIDGWSIWLLPVLIITIIYSFLFYYYYQKKKVGALLPNIKYQTPVQQSSVTITERLHTDSLRSSMAESMEKLSDALLTIASQEITINDLKIELDNKDAECIKSKEAIEDELNVLQLKLSTKNHEIEALTANLEQNALELAQTHEMLEKLLTPKTLRKKKTE